MKQTGKILQVQTVETPDTVVVVLSSIARTSLNAEKLTRLLDPLLDQIRKTEEENYKLFLERFELADDERTLKGYRVLATPLDWQEAKAGTSSGKQLSIRVFSLLEDAGFWTLLDACLRTKAELLAIPKFGETALSELQATASAVSGLALQWK